MATVPTPGAGVRWLARWWRRPSGRSGPTTCGGCAATGSGARRSRADREGSAWQRHDGAVTIRATDEMGLERARFMLALDADHSELHRRFGHDPLLGPSLRGLHGLRPLRTATVAHALLRAACGQLVSGTEARRIENGILRLAGTRAPEARELTCLSPAQLRSRGLATHRASSLVRVLRGGDLEKLHGVATPVVLDDSAASVASGPGRAGSSACRGTRALRPRQGRRPRPDQARLGAARPLGRRCRDGRVRRTVRRVAGTGDAVPDGRLLGRARPRCRPRRLAAAAAAGRARGRS